MPPTQTKRLHGTVRWFNRVSGFGFIRVEGERDVFVHESAIVRRGARVLDEGQLVELEIVERDGRREAADVTPVKDSQAAGA